MLPFLKTSGKRFCLVVLSCVLLSLGLSGLPHHVPTTHAATLSDFYEYTHDEVWKYDGSGLGGFAPIDDGSIPVEFVPFGRSSFYGQVSAVIAKSGDVWELRGHNLFKLTSDGCSSTSLGTSTTGWCLFQVDNNPATIQVVAGGNGQLFQIRSPGTVWKLAGICMCWQEIDANPQAVDLVAGAGKLFQLRNDATVWKYSGTPFDWIQVDKDPFYPTMGGILDMALDTNGTLYDVHFAITGNLITRTRVEQGFGPFNWKLIDDSNQTGALTFRIVTAGTQLYQMTFNNSLLAFIGTGWIKFTIDANLVEIAPAAITTSLFKEDSDHSVSVKDPQSSQWVLLSAPQPIFLGMSQPAFP